MRHPKRSLRSTQNRSLEQISRISRQSKRIISALQEAGYTLRKRPGKAYWHIDPQHALVWLGQSQEWCITPSNEELETIMNEALSHEKEGTK